MRSLDRLNVILEGIDGLNRLMEIARQNDDVEGLKRLRDNWIALELCLEGEIRQALVEIDAA